MPESSQEKKDENDSESVHSTSAEVIIPSPESSTTTTANHQQASNGENHNQQSSGSELARSENSANSVSPVIGPASRRSDRNRKVVKDHGASSSASGVTPGVVAVSAPAAPLQQQLSPGAVSLQQLEERVLAKQEAFGPSLQQQSKHQSSSQNSRSLQNLEAQLLTTQLLGDNSPQQWPVSQRNMQSLHEMEARILAKQSDAGPPPDKSGRSRSFTSRGSTQPGAVSVKPGIHTTQSQAGQPPLAQSGRTLKSLQNMEAKLLSGSAVIQPAHRMLDSSESSSSSHGRFNNALSALENDALAKISAQGSIPTHDTLLPSIAASPRGLEELVLAKERNPMSGSVQRLAALEETVLSKTTGLEIVTPASKRLQQEDLSVERQLSISSSHASVNSGDREAIQRRISKEEQGLTPGGPRPGAFTAEWILRPTTPENFGAVDNRVCNPREIDGSNHSLRSYPISNILEETIEDRAPVSFEQEQPAETPQHAPTTLALEYAHSEHVGQSESSSTTQNTGRRRRWLYVLIGILLVTVVVAIGAGVGITKSGPSNHDPQGPCDFTGVVQPDILQQCSCHGEVSVISPETRILYDVMRENVLSRYYSTFDEPRNSCSTRNKALLTTVSTRDKDEYDLEVLTEKYLLTTLFLKWNGTVPNAHGWLEPGSVCEWDGISCEDGRVVSFEMQFNKLQEGKLEDEFFELTKLTTLAIQKYNRFDCPIPSEIAKLSNLREIFLSCVNEGTLPSELGLLTSLEILSVTSFVSGTIPTEIGGMTSLQQFQLPLNLLTGTIPSEIGLLTQLRGIYLYSNFLSGSLPSELQNLQPTLERLDVGTLDAETNTFTDPNQVAWSFNNLLLLHLARISINSIPTEKLVLMTALTSLSIPGCGLSGEIPSEIGSLTSLTNINLRKNGLTGTLPSEIGLLLDLSEATFSSNFLGGSLPSSFSQLDALVTLRIGKNRFIGEVPRALCSLPNIELIAYDCDSQSCSCDVCTCSD